MLRFWIIDNIYDKMDKKFSFDSYEYDDITVGGFYTEEIQDLLKRGICNYHYLFSEQAKMEQATSYSNIGAHEIANMILDESTDNDTIINNLFGKYTGPIFIIKDGKGYFTNGQGYNSDKYDTFSFGFDLDEARCDREEFIRNLNIIPLISEIRNDYLTNTWEEFTDKYPYDYSL